MAGAKAAREFLEPMFSDRDQELMLVAFCDERFRLVKLLSFSGSQSAVQCSLADVFLQSVGTFGVLAAHNHPSGDSRPSEADLRFSRRLCLVAKAIDIALLDILIFGRDSMFSFRRQGLV